MRRRRATNRQLSDTYVYVGKQETRTSIRLCSYGSGAAPAERELKPEELPPAPWKAAEGIVDWYQVSGLSDAETVQRIVRACGLDSLDAKDVLTPEHVVKIEESDDRLLFILNLSYYNQQMEICSEHLGIIVAGNIVVSFTESDRPLFAEVRKALDSDMLGLRRKGPGMLLAFLLNTVTSALAEAAAKVEDTLEDIEEALLDIHSDQSGIGALIQQRRRDYLDIRRNSQPLKEQFSKLLRMDNTLITEELQPVYADLYDQMQFVTQTCDGCREIISSLVDLYISNNALRMDATMKRLTVVATVFIPLTFLVGVWGMNFRGMPELQWKYGYAAAWGLML
ncbi:MAG: magnesium and cobalt transport protein CorA, partial [Tannerella sp.]|nr:magnesium and cobalt transport protein CorA [Tannerella sp.]